jgi:hypothetical protein
MNTRSVILTALTIIFLASLFILTEAEAIPAFARRYNLSCNTCHAPVPKLKPYGDDFAGSGFIIAENEKERDYVTAGDDLLWLNKTFPIAVRFDAFAVMEPDATVKKDLEMPFGLKLLSGGALSKKIGYYFYFFMSEAGNIAGIEDAYIHFDNIFNIPLDVLVGQFQVCDPLMKRELRLTFEDYAIFGHRPGSSRTNLTYDRGLMLTYGIEKTSTDFVATITNGDGIDPANEVDEKFDNDDNKNFGLRLKQSVGRYLSIGGFYYKGKETRLLGIAEPAGRMTTNDIAYIGGDVSATAGPIEVTAQYLERKDSDPKFAGSIYAVEKKSNGTVVEIILAPQLDRSRIYFVALYNDVFSHSMEYQSLTLNSTYLLKRNLRLSAEYTRFLETDHDRIVLGMTTAF